MPERNLIQHPEMISRLRRWAGLKQMHTTPTLSETIQGVVVLDDLRERTTQDEAIKRGIAGVLYPDPVNASLMFVIGTLPGPPLGTQSLAFQRILRVRRFMIGMRPSALVAPTRTVFDFGWRLFSPIPVLNGTGLKQFTAISTEDAAILSPTLPSNLIVGVVDGVPALTPSVAVGVFAPGASSSWIEVPEHRCMPGTVFAVSIFGLDILQSTIWTCAWEWTLEHIPGT